MEIPPAPVHADLVTGLVYMLYICILLFKTRPVQNKPMHILSHKQNGTDMINKLH